MYIINMKERIKELAKQATEKFITYFDGRGNVTETYFDKEKFAELIVRECAGIAYEYDIPNLTGPGEFIGNRIKKHFGVEE